MPQYPAIQGAASYTPDNPPSTTKILTAAILAGSFFFVFAGDWAMPDQDAVHVNVSKYQIQTVDIVPYSKPTLSQAIRASIYEQTLPAVDASHGVVESGKTQWSEQIPPTGLDKWKPQYPDIVPARFHKELSPAIQSGYFSELGYSQAAGNWNSNAWKTGLYPDDFTSRYSDILPQWYFKAQGLPQSILSGSFSHANFSNGATKDWLSSPKNLGWFVETPDLQLRSKDGLPQAIQSGSYFHVNFGNKTLKDWSISPGSMSWLVESPDIIPSFNVKKGLLEAIQAGHFAQPPYMPLGINYVKNFIFEQFWPDVQEHWIFAVKKTLPAAILSGSFFSVPPVNAAKTWVQDLKDQGWGVELPDITYNIPKAGLSQSIQSGSFFFVPYSDGLALWNEIMIEQWQPSYPDRQNVTPQMTSAQLSMLEAAIIIPPTLPFENAGGEGLALGTILINLDDGEEIYLGGNLVQDL